MDCVLVSGLQISYFGTDFQCGYKWRNLIIRDRILLKIPSQHSLTRSFSLFYDWYLYEYMNKLVNGLLLAYSKFYDRYSLRIENLYKVIHNEVRKISGISGFNELIVPKFASSADVIVFPRLALNFLWVECLNYVYLLEFLRIFLWGFYVLGFIVFGLIFLTWGVKLIRNFCVIYKMEYRWYI